MVTAYMYTDTPEVDNCSIHCDEHRTNDNYTSLTIYCHRRFLLDKSQHSEAKLHTKHLSLGFRLDHSHCKNQSQIIIEIQMSFFKFQRLPHGGPGVCIPGGRSVLYKRVRHEVSTRDWGQRRAREGYSFVNTWFCLTPSTTKEPQDTSCGIPLDLGDHYAFKSQGAPFEYGHQLTPQYPAGEFGWSQFPNFLFSSVFVFCTEGSCARTCHFPSRKRCDNQRCLQSLY